MTRAQSFSYRWILRAILALFLLGAGNIPLLSAQGATTAITINGSGAGRVFDGVGAISGGGGTSRLLPDYPAQQQSEILDYLFKPQYGASLQILKVEIGGDTDSTNGAEASHMRTRAEENYQRGYEWWLMEQAKARNPNIKLAALEWGAPGWFSGGFWSQDNINYIIKWLQHARSDHNLTIDYIGGWNERGYNKVWYQNLKSALQSNGLSNVKVVADDGLGSSNWAVATDLKNDAAFRAAVDIAGTHYTTTSTADAQGLSQPLWSSENGSVHWDTGASTIASRLNHDYIDGRMTAYINWSAIAAWYSTLPFYPNGLMLADEPWSGAYKVGRDIWAMAHTAQFTQPGWRYIDSASATLAGGGSFVTLKSTNNSDYSVIIETTNASATQTVNIAVTGLSTGVVHVWRTNLNSTNASDYFVRASDITPSGGRYTLTLDPRSVYSLTTTTGQSKGGATPPASQIKSLPYSDTFDGYVSGKLAKYFSDINGAFETAGCGGGRSGLCYRQMIAAAPIAWTTGPSPTTVAGDPRWTNYRVSSDALLEQSGTVDLIGRMNANVHAQTGNQGYHLRVGTSGSWSLVRQTSSGANTTLASGSVAFPLNSWHNLALNMQGSTIQAFYDNTLLATATDSTYASGQAGFQVSGWLPAQFDNFAVAASGPAGPSSFTSTAVAQHSGQCLDVPSRSTANSVQLEQWTCNSGANQSFTFNPVAGAANTYTIANVNSGKCLDVSARSTADGAQVVQFTCSAGATNQQFRLQAAGTNSQDVNLIAVHSSKCVGVVGASMTAGALVEQRACGGAASQIWRLSGRP